MIINTENLRLRLIKSPDYVAIYGTEDNPYSNNYSLMSFDECQKVANHFDALSARMKDFADEIRDKASKLPHNP